MNQNSKKILPCKTFVATGFFRHGDKCDFIHDFRAKNNVGYYKILNKIPQNDLDKFTKVKPSFYFPSLNNSSEDKYWVTENKFYREKDLWDNFLLTLNLFKNKNYKEINKKKFFTEVVFKKKYFSEDRRLPVFIDISNKGLQGN